jgi:hypothetical protein
MPPQFAAYSAPAANRRTHWPVVPHALFSRSHHNHFRESNNGARQFNGTCVYPGRRFYLAVSDNGGSIYFTAMAASYDAGLARRILSHWSVAATSHDDMRNLQTSPFRFCNVIDRGNYYSRVGRNCNAGTRNARARAPDPLVPTVCRWIATVTAFLGHLVLLAVNSICLFS